MDKKELQIITELMEKLQDQMSEGESDFDERLGRKKPDAEIKVMKIEGKPELEREEDEMGMDLDGDDEMGEMRDDDEDLYHKPDMDDAAFEDSRSEENLSPEEKFKQRLMKLRGE